MPFDVFDSKNMILANLKSSIDKEILKDIPRLETAENIRYVKVNQKPVRNIPEKKVEYKPKQEKELRLIEGHKAYFGVGREQNYGEALDIYKTSAKDNMIEAFNCLGKMHLEGKGTKLDIKSAMEYYTTSAKRNDAEGYYQLGKMYMDGKIGKNMEKNEREKKSIEFFNKAAKYSHSEALYELGYISEKGIAKGRSLQEAELFYKESAELKNPKAMNNLACLYLAKNEDKQDFIEGESGRVIYELLESSRDLGYTPAITNLAKCYLKGIFVEKDLTVAKKLFKEAADKGDPEAKFSLAFFKLKDASIREDPEKYCQAADELRKVLCLDPEFYEAHYYLGYLHENGFGVDKDLTSAFRHYNKAASKPSEENSKALYKLGTMHMSGNAPNGQNIQKAIECLEKSSNLGDLDAENALG